MTSAVLWTLISIQLALGWTEPHGVLAMLILAVLIVEIVITLMDFVEEDMSRKLPASERVTHTLLTINYGAILALLIPVLAGWAGQPTAIVPVWYGLASVLAPLVAAGVILFAAGRRMIEMPRALPPPS